MKKVFFVLGLLSALGLTADSHRALLANKKLFLIPELGINSTSFSNTTSIAQIGFVAGLGIRIGKRTHMYTGIYYKAIRYEAQFNMNHVPVFTQVKADYFVIPVLIGITPIKAPLFQFRLFGGGAAYFNHPGEVSRISGLDINKTMWNMRVGAGINIWKIECNFSYDFGITRMFETVSNGKSYGYSVTLGFRF